LGFQEGDYDDKKSAMSKTQQSHWRAGKSMAPDNVTYEL